MRCFIIIVMLALTACKSASDLDGSWVGKSGPFKATLKFDRGVGKLCYSGKYQGVERYVFVRDDKLVKSGWYCRKMLSGK